MRATWRVTPRVLLLSLPVPACVRVSVVMPSFLDASVHRSVQWLVYSYTIALRSMYSSISFYIIGGHISWGGRQHRHTTSTAIIFFLRLPPAVLSFTAVLFIARAGLTAVAEYATFYLTPVLLYTEYVLYKHVY